jgi:PAS domain S-box-containing protein
VLLQLLADTRKGPGFWWLLGFCLHLARIQENHVSSTETIQSTLADAIAAAILIYRDGRCHYANRAAQLLTGYSVDELLALSFQDLLHTDSRSLAVEQGVTGLLNGSGNGRFEISIITKNGERRPWDATIAPVYLGGARAGLITAVDITGRPKREVSRESSATSDPMTGVLNNSQLEIAVRSEIKRSERNGRSFALLLLKLREPGDTPTSEAPPSLDRNESQRRLVQLVESVCRSGDTLFRSGEEFFVLLPETPMAGVRQLTLRLGERMVSASGQSDFSTLQLVGGLAVFPQDGPTLDHLLRAARRTIRKIGIKRPGAASLAQDQVDGSLSAVGIDTAAGAQSKGKNAGNANAGFARGPDFFTRTLRQSFQAQTITPSQRRP